MRTIGRHEIAQMLGYTLKYVRDDITKRPDFPKPVLRLSTHHVKWDEADIRRWMSKQTQAA